MGVVRHEYVAEIGLHGVTFNEQRKKNIQTHNSTFIQREDSNQYANNYNTKAKKKGYALKV